VTQRTRLALKEIRAARGPCRAAVGASPVGGGGPGRCHWRAPRDQGSACGPAAGPRHPAEEHGTVRPRRGPAPPRGPTTGAAARRRTVTAQQGGAPIKTDASTSTCGSGCRQNWLIGLRDEIHQAHDASLRAMCTTHSPRSPAGTYLLGLFSWLKVHPVSALGLRRPPHPRNGRVTTTPHRRTGALFA
jgi:hypothetical protein